MEKNFNLSCNKLLDDFSKYCKGKDNSLNASDNKIVEAFLKYSKERDNNDLEAPDNI